jgi:AhpD family alkylhydroperoxidase
MNGWQPIEYDDASPEVRAVYDDIRNTRGADYLNAVWRVLANDPPLLARSWRNVKETMAPGALDPLTKELIYLAVSMTNGCEYCIGTHSAGARAKGMSSEQFGELLAVVGLANQLNAVVKGAAVPLDARYQT